MTTPYMKKTKYHFEETALPQKGQRFLYASTVFSKKPHRGISIAWGCAFPRGSVAYAWGNIVFPGHGATVIKSLPWCEYAAKYP